MTHKKPTHETLTQKTLTQKIMPKETMTQKTMTQKTMTKETMIRKEKEITDTSDIETVIAQTPVCRLGLSDGAAPYIVPLCFGYEDGTIYVHSALKGKKIDLIQTHPDVCVEFDTDVETIDSGRACNWGMSYKSVIAFGRASFLENRDEKKRALGIIIGHYSDKSFALPDKAVDKTAVIKIEISRMTGKQSRI